MTDRLRRLWATMTATPRRRVLSGLGAVVAMVAVGALLIVVGGDDQDVTTAPPTSSSSTTAVVPDSSVPATTALPPVPDDGLRFLPEDVADNGSSAPLTGLPAEDPAVLDRPALAIKVDNLDVAGESARPQVGLAFADVVIEEVVEGGITRFVAVLHSTDSPDVGPVRSARTTDVDLLPFLGAPLFAYSGGNPGVLAEVAAAPNIIDRGGEWAPAYFRMSGRRAPHNLFLRPQEIWARPGAAQPPRTLASFRPRGEGSPIGEAVKGLTVSLPGSATAPVAWSWLPEHQRWLRSQRGTVHLDGAGYAIGPRNVIVMITDYVPSSADPRSPEGQSIGSGEAWFFTDGKLVVGRWERPSIDAPLAFIGPDGALVSLSSGRTWIELVPPGRAQVVR